MTLLSVLVLTVAKQWFVVCCYMKLSLQNFSEIAVTEWRSRALMCKSGPMEGLPMETVSGDGNCQIFLLKFSADGPPAHVTVGSMAQYRPTDMRCSVACCSWPRTSCGDGHAGHRAPPDGVLSAHRGLSFPGDICVAAAPCGQSQWQQAGARR